MHCLTEMPAVPLSGDTKHPGTSPAFFSRFSVERHGEEEYNGINNLLRVLFSPTVSVQSIHPLEGHLHCLRLLILSNGTRLLFKGSPMPATALLRQERFLLETESRVLALLRQNANPCIPQIFHYNSQRSIPEPAFLVRHYIPGLTLQDMEAQLTVRERENVDRHLGFLANTIGQHVAPSFGPLEQVTRGSGKRSWRDAFIALFETTLRDAEDMFVHLPYTEIRHHLHRLAPALEAITLPRLVVVDFGQPSQVLLDPMSKRLSGITDFGHALWGDIFMAEVFDNPSSSLLEGFGLRQAQSKLGGIRQLLYVS